MSCLSAAPGGERGARDRARTPGRPAVPVPALPRVHHRPWVHRESLPVQQPLQPREEGQWHADQPHVRAGCVHPAHRQRRGARRREEDSTRWVFCVFFCLPQRHLIVLSLNLGYFRKAEQTQVSAPRIIIKMQNGEFYRLSKLFELKLEFVYFNAWILA